MMLMQSRFPEQKDLAKYITVTVIYDYPLIGLEMDVRLHFQFRGRKDLIYGGMQATTINDIYIHTSKGSVGEGCAIM